MIGPDIDPAEFDQLLSTLCDSELAPAESVRLNRLLRSEPALRRRYVLYLGIHGTLQYTMGEAGIIEAEGIADSTNAIEPRGQRSRDAARFRRSRWRPRRLGRAAAVVILLAGVTGWWLRRPSRPVSPVAGPVVARVSGGAGVRFDVTGLSSGVNDPMHAGVYRLLEGIVQVTFGSGAEVMIAAPAEFTLQGEKRLLLKCGKLTAKVPEQAKGFVVETPSATLMDLGTEFAMDVDRARNGEVHVFRGEVIVQPRSQTDLRPVRLVEAHATRIDGASATPSGIDVDPSRFLRQFDEPESAYSRLVRELGPQIYLNMEPTRDGHSLIDAGSHGRVGGVVLEPSTGTPWYPGRFGTSLQFRGPGFGDHAITGARPDEIGESLTVVAWVLARSRPRWASIVKRWGRPEDHSFHFGLYLDDGDLEVHTAQADGLEFIAREGRPLPTGRWQHVAFVADRTTLRLYRNGAEVAQTDHPGLRPGTLNAIGIGAKLNITADAPDPIEPGYWHGRIDEVAIFPRALEAREVRRLYEAAAGTDSEANHQDDGPAPAAAMAGAGQR